MGSRESSCGHRIGQLHRLIRLHIRTDLRRLGLRAGQIPFLAKLFHEEGQIQDQLSARLHIDKAATARAVEEQLFTPLRDVTRHLSEGFTDREREMALTLLDRMIRNLQQPAPCAEENS